MTDPPPRQWTLSEVQALTDSEVRDLSPEEFTEAIRVAQAEGTPAAPARRTRGPPLPMDTARIYLRPPRPGSTPGTEGNWTG